MGDLDEIRELTNDKKILRKKLIDAISTPEYEKFHKELLIINRRLMKLRNRN